MSIDSFQASARFGLGPHQGEDVAIGKDPRNWLLSQLEHPEIPREIAGLKDNSPATQALINHLRNKKIGNAEGSLKAVRAAYVQESGTRFLVQKRSSQPFIERLTMFWSNHFTVSIQKAVVAGLANKFEVEAIRPHVTGRFADMLKAVTQHPAMLLYLDNAQSFGPNSPLGTRHEKGLNENLAREILELQTLGVNGGYTQNDVIALANIITGWTLSRDDGVIAPQFSFKSAAHEPGSKTLLGKTYAENGINEGLSALDDLARHPSTARFIATKLARHFIADDPPPPAVEKLAQIFQKTDGNLKAVSRTLVEMKECWDTPLAKFKTPYEFMLSALRLTDIEPTPEQVVSSLEGLNYRMFSAASPAGFPDVASAWSSPDAVMKRIEWAQALSKRISAKTDPLRLADTAFGPVMREETRFVIAGAETGKDGLSFLLTSPEFQRR